MADPWIRTAAELDDLVAELSRSRAIGIDTEGDSLHHYTDKVCLIQVSAFGGGAWLVDPLAITDLSPLAPVLTDRSIVKVVHGGENDVTSLRREFGFAFKTMFDTAIAARLLGDAEVGLQALVRNELGIELDKSSQRDDWSKRPLTERQERYALADVEHLMALATRMTARLAAAGRTEWAREEFEALAELEAAEKRRGPDEFRRIKGSAALSPRGQAILRELHVWREARAEAADCPPFKVVAPDVLVALAEEMPETVEEVQRMVRRFPRAAGEAEALLDAIDRGLDLPDEELPARERGERPFVSPATKRRLEALRVWRREQAERSKLDPAIVLSEKLAQRVAAAAPQTKADLLAVDGLRRWRVHEWGDALLDACA
ncbi:MAG TPA: HRDC domain-containing protein [Kofleriaceae bacterium]|nr:HRDC domain-containing protein [Kofleriaceae bacterium]